jgi:hypothetical protein
VVSLVQYYVPGATVSGSVWYFICTVSHSSVNAINWKQLVLKSSEIACSPKRIFFSGRRLEDV